MARRAKLRNWDFYYICHRLSLEEARATTPQKVNCLPKNKGTKANMSLSLKVKTLSEIEKIKHTFAQQAKIKQNCTWKNSIGRGGRDPMTVWDGREPKPVKCENLSYYKIDRCIYWPAVQ